MKAKGWIDTCSDGFISFLTFISFDPLQKFSTKFKPQIRPAASWMHLRLTLDLAYLHQLIASALGVAYSVATMPPCKPEESVPIRIPNKESSACNHLIIPEKRSIKDQNQSQLCQISTLNSFNWRNCAPQNRGRHLKSVEHADENIRVVVFSNISWIILSLYYDSELFSFSPFFGRGRVFRESSELGSIIGGQNISYKLLTWSHLYLKDHSTVAILDKRGKSTLHVAK